MKLKYVVFYLSLITIISLTIYLMFIISSSTKNTTPKQYVEKNINSEAVKIDNNLFWIYDSSISIDKNSIPIINIKNKNVEAINEELAKQIENINGSYIYSITGDLLSVMYSSQNKYLIYNINLGTNKVLNSIETLEYADINILKVKAKIKSSIEMYLKGRNLTDEQYFEYYNKTIDNFNIKITDNELKIYVIKNKEINVCLDIYLPSGIETNLINIVDI